MKIEICIKTIEGCCNDLSIARKWAKPPGSKFKKWAQEFCGHEKWSKATGVKF
jgi:hypothetical protein